MDAELTELEKKWATAKTAAKPLTDAQTAQIARSFRRNVVFQLAKRAQMDKRAHEAGVIAKHRGWHRVSPYYKDPMSDRFWFAGYDGETWDKASGDFREAAKEIQ